MKKLIILTGLLFALGIQAKAQAWAASAETFQAAAAGGCTPASGNVTNEWFSGTGYQLANWTEVSGSPDEDYALPGTSPCSALSQGLRANYTGTDIISRFPFSGVDTTTLYHRFYLYVASESLADTQESILYQCSETATITEYPRFRIYLSQVGGQLQLYGFSTSQSTSINISTGTWYRIEVMSVINNTTSELKVFDSGGSQVGSTVTFTTGNYWSRYIYVGHWGGDNTANGDTTITGIGITTSGYLGQ